MWTRVELKNRAKAIMRICYWKVFLICLLAALLGAISDFDTSSFQINFNAETGITTQLQLGPFKYVIPMTGIFISSFGASLALATAAAVILFRIFFVNVLRVGFCRYLILTQKKGESAPASELLWGFRCGHYGNLVKIMFLHSLYIFLWGLLFIVPGIVKRLEYFCVPYILAKHPDTDSRQIFAMSSEMTNGQKWDMFVLDLSFIGWQILGSLLFGIGTYFVLPYIELTSGELYAVLTPFSDSESDSFDSYEGGSGYSYN